MSLASNSKSSHDPRYGMIRAANTSFPEESEIGNTDLKPACRPWSSERPPGGSLTIRKSSYELFCTSMRLGIAATSAMLPNFLRNRLRPVNVSAMSAPILPAGRLHPRLRVAHDGGLPPPRNCNAAERFETLRNFKTAHRKAHTKAAAPVRFSGEPSSLRSGGGRSRRPASPRVVHMQRPSLDLDSCSSRLELLLELFGVVLRNAFVDGFAAGLDAVLGFLEAEARDRAHVADDVDLLVATRLEDDGELGLLLDGG